MQPPLFNIFFYPSFTDSFDHRILFPHCTFEYPPEPGPPRKHWEILSLGLFPLVPRISSCSKEPADLRMLAGHFSPKAASPRAKSAGWSPELQKPRKLTGYTTDCSPGSSAWNWRCELGTGREAAVVARRRHWLGWYLCSAGQRRRAIPGLHAGRALERVS